MSKVFEFDTEFNDVRQPYLSPVAAVICEPGVLKSFSIITHKRPENINKLKNKLKTLENYICTCYSAAAEARFMLAVGVDPRKYKWLDLWVAHRWLHNFPGCMKLQKTDLLSCCKDNGVVYNHPEQKAEMRDIIINSNSFTDKDINLKILEYCYEDTKVLAPLRQKILNRLSQQYKLPMQRVVNILLYLSKYSAYMGICENAGLPIDMDALAAITQNAPKLRFRLIEQIKYPFYVWDAGKDDYMQKYYIFKDYIEMNGFDKQWKKTEKGFYSTNKEVLESNKYLSPEINSLYETNKILSQLKSISSKKNKEGLYAFIGSDNRCRARMFPFGTQSGRNSPKASQFPLGMSSVFRILIRPAPGRAITGVDWAAQEFILAAALSGDTNMLAAYSSGDPYAFFAIKAGAIPEDGNKKTHPKVRNLFKSTTLGLQYSMGIEKLTNKLTIDTKEKVSTAKAQKLIDLHKQIFKQYWAWVARRDSKTRKGMVSHTLDGFSIVADLLSFTSLRNWPIQAGGAALMRRAIISAIECGLNVLTPHHDAIYIEHAEGDDTDIKKLKECMDEAVSFYFKDIIIRCDITTHTHNEVWVEEKGEEMYEQFKEYFSTDAKITTKYEPNPILEFFPLGSNPDLNTIL